VVHQAVGYHRYDTAADLQLVQARSFGLVTVARTVIAHLPSTAPWRGSYRRPMLQRLEQYLRMSGFTEPSLVQLRPDLPRWVRHLRARGVTSIPSVYSRRPEDAQASNEIILLIKQSMPERD
jgi:hypothetical protein